MALILLIDDDPLIAEIVSAALGKAGHIVGVLTDGQGAPDVIELKRPVLVLLDCAMPLLPGVEVLRRIRASRTCFDIPVMMLTARGQASDRDIAMRAGATAYMCKPLDVEHLILKVDQMICESSHVAPALGPRKALGR